MGLKPYKIRIIGCLSKDYWYVKHVGKIVTVRDLSWPSPFVECIRGAGKDNGAAILRLDTMRVIVEKLTAGSKWKNPKGDWVKVARRDFDTIYYNTSNSIQWVGGAKECSVKRFKQILSRGKYRRVR